MKIFIITAVIILVLALLYFQSGQFKRKWANLTGYSTVCVDGVKYIQFTSGATVKYTKEGQIELCKEIF